MAPPKKRLKTSHDETSKKISKAVASAYLTIFDNDTDGGPRFFRFTKKRTTFDAEDLDGPFGVAFSRMKPEGATLPVRISFTVDTAGRYTLRVPRGVSLLTVCINSRRVSPLVHGVRLKNGDQVLMYCQGKDSASERWWQCISGRIVFHFFVGEEHQPKRRVTSKSPNWALLPPEILEKILNRVPVCDLLYNVAGTCQRFRDLVFSGRLKLSPLELATWPTRSELAALELIYGPHGLSQKETVVVRNARVGCWAVRNTLLRRLEHLKSLDLRCPGDCDCNSMAFLKSDELHPNAQLKALKVYRETCDRRNWNTRELLNDLRGLLSSSMETFCLSAPNNSNPPSYLQQLMDRVESSSCTFVYSCGDWRSDWKFEPSVIGQEARRLLYFDGVYFKGLNLCVRNLVSLKLIIPGKSLRVFLQNVVFSVILWDLSLNIKDDGQFNVDHLKPPRTAVNLKTLDLVLPEITHEFCEELCLHNPLLTKISIQLTSVDIPQSALELLQNKQGLQHLSVIGPTIFRE